MAKGYAVTYFDSSTVLRDKRYGYTRAEAYMTMREALQVGTAAIPSNEELVMELLAVKYEVKNGGRTFIEPEDNVRDRIGVVRTWPTFVRWHSAARPRCAAWAAPSVTSGSS